MKAQTEFNLKRHESLGSLMNRAQHPPACSLMLPIKERIKLFDSA